MAIDAALFELSPSKIVNLNSLGDTENSSTKSFVVARQDGHR